MGPDRNQSMRSALPIAAALVEQLVAAMAQARLHELSHPRVATPISAVQGCLRRLERELGDTHVDMQVEGERMVLAGRIELPRSPATTRLVHSLRARSIGGLRLACVAQPADFAALFSLLMSPTDGDRRTTRDLNSALAAAGADRIELLAPPAEPTTAPRVRVAAGAPAANAPPARRYTPSIAPPTKEPALVKIARSVLTAAVSGRSFDVAGMTDAVSTLAARALERQGVTFDLSVRRHEDPDGAWHAARTCALAIEVGRTLTADPRTLASLGAAALLHDVGEIMLPEAARGAGAHPDPELREQWQAHTDLGAEYLLGLPGVDPLWVSVALTHHRNHVGGGYPKMFHDHVQSPFAQLVRIADAYEVLTAPALHREELDPTHAFRVLLSARGELSSSLLRRFVETVGFQPIGSVVRLTSGEVARVIRQSEDIELPIVVVVASAQGRPVPAAERRALDLSHPAPGAPRLAGRA